MQRSQKLIGAALLAATVLLTTACGGQKPAPAPAGGTAAPAPAAKKEVSIGMTAPLTGDNAQYGENFKNAANLAINAFNAKSKEYTVKLVAQDSKADPKESANIVQNFVGDKNMVAVLGDFTSTASMAAAPIMQRSKMVQLSPTASHPDFTKQGNFIFRNIVTQEIEGSFLGDYAYNKLGKKKAAVIYIQNDWGIAAHENFVKAFKALGGEVTTIEKFNPGTKDFANLLTKIKESKPEILYLGAMYTETALIAQQAKKLDLNVAMIGTGSLYSDKLIELGGDAVEGIYTSSAFFPGDPRPEVQAFVKDFKAAYGGKEPDMFAAQAYDATNLLLSVIEKGVTDREKFRDALAAIKDYPGVTGKTTFNENRDVVKDMTRLQVKGGKFTVFNAK